MNYGRTFFSPSKDQLIVPNQGWFFISSAPLAPKRFAGSLINNYLQFNFKLRIINNFLYKILSFFRNCNH